MGSDAWRDRCEFEVDVGFAPPVNPMYTRTIPGPDGQPQHLVSMWEMFELVLPNQNRWDAYENVIMRNRIGVSEIAMFPTSNEEHTENRKALLQELQRRDN